jgi:hypothetical protein
MSERIGIESFGVRVAVLVDDSVSPNIRRAVRTVLPPGAVAVDPARALGTVTLTWRHDRYCVTDAGGDVTRFGSADEAVHQVDRDVRAVVSLLAPDHVFIHAGVVAAAGGAIVLPGPSFAGKTTLVAALLRAGAAYLSDEYAVLDAAGMVHPYPRALSVRDAASARIDLPAERFGARSTPHPVPITVVASTSFRAGASWCPSEGTSGAAAMAMMANAVAARVRPVAVMAATTAAARRARYVEGERGEAAEVAGRLLALAGGPSLSPSS